MAVVALSALSAASVLAVPCSACHLETATHFKDSKHGLAFLSTTQSNSESGAEGSTKSRFGEGDAQCALCHGAGTEHVGNPTAGTIRTFGAGTPGDAKAQNAVCTTCHENQQHPEANAHTLAGVACASCHKVHVAGVEDHGHLSDLRPIEPLSVHSIVKRDSQGKAEAKGKKKLEHDPLPGVTECVGCHQDTAAQFTFNERHRLAPGGVTCTSCHDPHKPTVTAGLGGFSGGLEQGCSDCHSNLAGPFVYEHGASRVEGCGACHSPHGSPNRHMLEFQEVGELCYSCHAEVPQFHTGFAPGTPARFDLQTQCTSCHVAVHGSNHDRALLR